MSDSQLSFLPFNRFAIAPLHRRTVIPSHHCTVVPSHRRTLVPFCQNIYYLSSVYLRYAER